MHIEKCKVPVLEDENYNVAGKEENKAIIEELSKKLLENRGDNYEK